ncbi:unnamed protein product [Calicophoron daubneyi]|uniref:Nudix hydrolase domain-containing protein n=1 Tax=Calicophoron daubneyi TaxID=300641 RepID=A0AAV2U2H3_CALDB
MITASPRWMSVYRLFSQKCNCQIRKTSASAILVFHNDVRRDLENFLQLSTWHAPQSSQDYDVLLLKRPLNSTFGGRLVFPGGALAKGDFMRDVWSSLPSLTRTYSFPPPVYQELERDLIRGGKDKDFRPHVALRLCAIREIFEETGLLLVADTNSGNGSQVKGLLLSPTDTRSWRSRLADNPSLLATLYKAVGYHPPISSLYEWSNWLTPSNAARRFDTMFYFVAIDSVVSEAPGLGPVKPSSCEVTSLFANPPLSFLPTSIKHFAVPQVYELGRLSHFDKLSQLSTFARQRSVLGCRRWCPEILRLPKGTGHCDVLLLPGDQRYDEIKNSSSWKSLTFDDIAGDTIRNRLFLSPDVSDLWIDSNFYECGHVPPMNKSEYLSACSVN